MYKNLNKNDESAARPLRATEFELVSLDYPPLGLLFMAIQLKQLRDGARKKDYEKSAIFRITVRP
jgi:hypothetical protein